MSVLLGDSTDVDALGFTLKQLPFSTGAVIGVSRQSKALPAGSTSEVVFDIVWPGRDIAKLTELAGWAVRRLRDIDQRSICHIGPQHPDCFRQLSRRENLVAHEEFCTFLALLFHVLAPNFVLDTYPRCITPAVRCITRDVLS